MKINLLGSFSSLDEVWAQYPEGGREGDYVIIGSTEIEWNKYTHNWGGEGSESSSVRPATLFDGSVIINGSLSIGGSINADALNKYALKTELVKLTPERVASEEDMQNKIDTGAYVEGQIYYIPEES